jgi:hypothetical protein
VGLRCAGIADICRARHQLPTSSSGRTLAAGEQVILVLLWRGAGFFFLSTGGGPVGMGRRRGGECWYYGVKRRFVCVHRCMLWVGRQWVERLCDRQKGGLIRNYRNWPGAGPTLEAGAEGNISSCAVGLC